MSLEFRFRDKVDMMDTLRGITSAQFPWAIEVIKFLDREGDPWVLTVTCEGIEHASSPKKILAKIRAVGICQVSDKNIKKMNFDPERMNLLGFQNWKEIKTEDFFKVETSIDDVFLKGQKFAEQIKKKAFNLFSFKDKEIQVRKSITERPVSGFEL